MVKRIFLGIGPKLRAEIIRSQNLLILDAIFSTLKIKCFIKHDNIAKF